MELLEHPLEAIAFRLYSLPEASSVATGTAAWTCLAAVLAAAAAAGLWRLRSSAPAAGTGAAPKRLELDRSSPAEEVSAVTASSSERSPPEPAASPALSPKERYTVYYRDAGCVGCCDVDDEERDNDDDEEEEDDGGAYDPPTETRDPFGWEVVRSSLPLTPTAAAGLRRYRSPTALGGSVVRLWDQGSDGGALTPTASPRRRGRALGAVSTF